MKSILARRWLSLTAPVLLLLGSCAHSGSDGSVGGGGNPPPPPPSFTLDDLMGDWIGQLEPNSSARQIQNFYLRFAGDQLVECADSAGNEWTLTNSDRDFTWSTSGLLEAEVALQLGTSTLTVRARMNAARAVLTGTYVQVGADLVPVRGKLTLTRSAPDAFEIAQLDGKWAGTAARVGGLGQGLELGFDTGGEVLGGVIRRRNGTVRRLFLSGAATFAFFDTSIGRLEEVTITATNGFSSTFHYLLLDADGTLLAGPGTDQVFGAGLIRLEPAVAAP